MQCVYHMMLYTHVHVPAVVVQSAGRAAHPPRGRPPVRHSTAPEEGKRVGEDRVMTEGSEGRPLRGRPPVRRNTAPKGGK